MRCASILCFPPVRSRNPTGSCCRAIPLRFRGPRKITQHAEPFPAETQPIFWTDDYCDLLHIIRWRD